MRIVNKGRELGEGITGAMAALGNGAALALAWVLTYTGLPVEPVAGLIFMMTADLITGMTRAYVQGEKLTTQRFKAGFLVKLMIVLIPGLVAVTYQSAIAMFPEVGDYRDIVKFCVMAIIVGELISAIANVRAAYTGEPKREWDYLSWIISRLYRLLQAVDKR